jgi:hypothetical protein
VTDRKVLISRANADVVVKPSIEAEGRLFEKPGDLRQGLSAGQKVKGITLRHVFRQEFDSKDWEVTGKVGEFRLIPGTSDWRGASPSCMGSRMMSFTLTVAEGMEGLTRFEGI